MFLRLPEIYFEKAYFKLVTAVVIRNKFKFTDNGITEHFFTLIESLMAEVSFTILTND